MTAVNGLRHGAELRLNRITKMYGAVAAVDNLDLTVAPGEFVTLLGASGSGKTTTLMMLAGFTSPTSGEINIGGRDVTNLPPGKRNLGVVFQNYALFPHLTVAQNLAFPLQMRGVDGRSISTAVKQALELVRLPEKHGSFPRELSGGQQQRIALARAIIFQPQALLMDEPLGALDKNLREHMQSEIKQIHKSLGATVVFVTHDQEEALTMSDRIAVMHNGSIAQIDAAEAVYERPATRWVAEFIGQSNFLSGQIVSRSGESYLVALGSGERIIAQGPANLPIGQQVLGVLRPESVRVAPQNKTGTANRINAKIVGVLYFGHTIKLRVRLGDGSELITQATRDGQTTIPEMGSDLSVVWDPTSVWLVHASKAAA